MKHIFKSILALILVSVLITVITAPSGAQQKAAAPAVPAQQKAIKAETPILVTTCGQGKTTSYFSLFLGSNKLKLDYVLEAEATAELLQTKKKEGKPFKSVIVCTGTSMKGMGAAGVSIEDEIARINALIAEAKKQGILIIGTHTTGLENRSIGTGDETDEQSIDAVCPQSSILIVKNEGNTDGKFTKIAKQKNIQILTYEKSLELETVLKNLYGK